MRATQAHFVKTLLRDQFSTINAIVLNKIFNFFVRVSGLAGQISLKWQKYAQNGFD